MTPKANPQDIVSISNNWMVPHLYMKLGRVVEVNHHPGQWPEYVYHVIFPEVNDEPIILNEYNIYKVPDTVYCVGELDHPRDHDQLFWEYDDAIDYVNDNQRDYAQGVWKTERGFATLVGIHAWGRWFLEEDADDRG